MAFDWLEFRRGVIDILPVVAAAIPIGLLFGTLAVAKGLAPVRRTADERHGVWWRGAVRRRRSVDQSGPVVLLTLTVLIVNIRHVLMGISFSRHLSGFPPAQRPLAMFFLVDEIWAFAERRALGGPVPPDYWWGMGMPCGCNGSPAPRSAHFSAEPRQIRRPSASTSPSRRSSCASCMGFWRTGMTGAGARRQRRGSGAAKLIIPGAWYIVLGGLAGVAVAYALGDDNPGESRNRLSAGYATVLAIAGMAIATYITRIAGLFLMRFMKVEGRAKTALDAMPPAILMAVVAPVAFATGPAETAATVITVLAALRLPLIVAVIIGVVSVAAAAPAGRRRAACKRGGRPGPAIRRSASSRNGPISRRTRA